MKDVNKVNEKLILALEERLEYQKDVTNIYKEHSVTLQSQLDSANRMIEELLEINKTLIDLHKPMVIQKIK